MKLAKFEGKPEIFYSIQGEGKTMGRPSVFVRCSLCNLHCIWCDTDYTWNWKGTRFLHLRDKEPDYSKYDKADFIIELSPPEVRELVLSFHCKNVILTGGEPLLQQIELIDLMQLLQNADSGFRFEVETNGTLLPKPEFDKLVHQYNVCPKLQNAGMGQKKRERPAVFDFFSKNEKAVFKFVVATKEDVEEILTLVSKHGLCPEKIYLMPEGISSENLRQKQIWLVEICKKYNFNFTDRLHIHLFGAKRGV